MSISKGINDADLAMLEDYLEGLIVPDERMAEVKIGELRGLIVRLRAAEAGSKEPELEAAAKKLAECMDYPWSYMPEEGRNNMRKHARSIIEAAYEVRP